MVVADAILSSLCADGADSDGGFFSPGRSAQEYPLKIVWKTGFIRLVLVAGIVWMLLILVVLLFHIWSCQSSVSFLSGIFFKCFFFFEICFFYFELFSQFMLCQNFSH